MSEVLRITDEEALQITDQVRALAVEHGISIEKLMGITNHFKNGVKDALSLPELEKNKYSIFGNPDEKQKTLIDSWDEVFINKMNGVLKFTENTIEITTNGNKLVFDKEQPIKGQMNWNDSMNAVKEIDRKLLSKEEFGDLSKMFYKKDEIIGDILSVSNDYYWSSTVYAYNTSYAWYGLFSYGYTDYIYKTNNGRVLCIHD